MGFAMTRKCFIMDFSTQGDIARYTRCTHARQRVLDMQGRHTDVREREIRVHTT